MARTSLRGAVGKALLLLALAAPALAQEIPPAVANSTPEERAEMQTRVMKEKLGLSEEQLPQVESINLDAAKKMEPVLKGNLGPLVRRRTAKQVDAEREAALQKVLTPSQFQQLQVVRDEIRQTVEQRLMAKKAGGAAP